MSKPATREVARHDEEDSKESRSPADDERVVHDWLLTSLKSDNDDHATTTTSSTVSEVVYPLSRVPSVQRQRAVKRANHGGLFMGCNAYPLCGYPTTRPDWKAKHKKGLSKAK